MSRQNERNDRIGVEFTTNEGYQVIVMDYVNGKKVQIMFLDEHKYKMWTQWSKLESGSVKNPFHKSVYGVGFLGLDENGERLKTRENGKPLREYQCWFGMFERAYSTDLHKRNPTYENVTVCKEWHSFSQFLKDLPKIKNYELWRDNPNSGITLNKDMYYVELGIDTNEKTYSLETCRFMTRSDSSKEMAERTGFSQVRKKLN